MYTIILWGTGKMGEKLLEHLKKYNNHIEIAAVVDNADEKQGKVWNGYKIQNPEIIKSILFDKIIASPYIYNQVYNQLSDEFGQAYQTRLDNSYFLLKEKFLSYYAGESEPEKIECIEFIKNNPIDVFNYEFTKKYFGMKIDIQLDRSNGLYYVYYKSKRMYLSRKFDTMPKAELYIRQILLEQDEMSPHRYFDDQFAVGQDSILMDAGVAEGNFALEIIDKVKKIYLVEADALWVEALSYTFAPFIDKVTIIHGFLSDNSMNGCVTIDEIVKENQLNYIKMDIEGSELSALKGGKLTLLRNNIQLAVCCYHKEDDFENIKSLLDTYGYESVGKKGYMIFVTGDNFTALKIPKLVRGILYGKRVNLEENIL